MADAFVDPYLIPETDTLKNKLGLTDSAELEQFEGSFSAVRLIELSNRAMSGNLDYDHLKKIHRYLFDDVYEWAGEPRTVDISKANSFVPAINVNMAATQVMDGLAADNHLLGMDRKAFVDRAAYHFGEINFVHPFRDGNGRTQRAFIDQVAQRAGYSFQWDRVSQGEMIDASIHSAGIDHSKLRIVLDKALVEPLIEKERAERLDTLAANDSNAYETISGIRDKLLTISNDSITTQASREKFANAVTDRLLDQHDKGRVSTIHKPTEPDLPDKDLEGNER